MQSLFFELIKLSLIGSLFALAVVFVRLVFRKAPKWIFVLLWGVVAIRLIMPFSIESSLSLVPDKLATGQIITNVSDNYVGEVDIIYDSNPEYSGALEAGRQPIHTEQGNYVITQKDSLKAPKTVGETVFPVFGWVWLTGMVLMLSYSTVSLFRLKGKMREATLLCENIWQSEHVDSPFVLGVFYPRIYLPYEITSCDAVNVIAHEKAHIHRKDHWWKPIGFLLLSVHWFNPVIWISYILLCRDIEAACDEKVIKHMDQDELRAYSTALLNCSIHRRQIAACPLAFGEVGVKARVRSVMHYKKPAFWIIVVGIILSVTVAICFLTTPKAKSYEENDQEKLSASLLTLKENYPEYFDLNAADGLDVYVWQMSENSYSFGLLPHSNDAREYLFDGWMKLKGVNATQMKEILMTYSVEEGNVYIIPWQHPLSSYLPEFCIVTEGVDMDKKKADYAEHVRKMLFDMPAKDDESIGGSETEDNQQQQSGNSTTNVECAYIQLYYHGNRQNSIRIEDKAVCTELLTMLINVKGQKADSTKGHYGVPFTLEVYQDEYSEPVKFSIWDRNRFSSSEWKGSDGYEFFMDGDLTELYNYLEEHYPANVWYPDEETSNIIDNNIANIEQNTGLQHHEGDSVIINTTPGTIPEEEILMGITVWAKKEKGIDIKSQNPDFDFLFSIYGTAPHPVRIP